MFVIICLIKKKQIVIMTQHLCISTEQLSKRSISQQTVLLYLFFWVLECWLDLDSSQWDAGAPIALHAIVI